MKRVYIGRLEASLWKKQGELGRKRGLFMEKQGITGNNGRKEVSFSEKQGITGERRPLLVRNREYNGVYMPP